MADGKELRRWESMADDSYGGNTDANKRIVYSPDGKILASAEKGRVTLWDPATGEPSTKKILCPFLPTEKDSPVAFDIQRLMALYCRRLYQRSGLYLWDLKADTLVRSIVDAGQGLPIYVLNFTHDGKTLVSQAHQSPLGPLVGRGQQQRAFAFAR